MKTAVKTHTPMTWTSPATTAMFWAAMGEHSHALARRVIGLRKAKGWSKERLANEAGVSYKTIVRIENAEVLKPANSTYDKLAEALDVDVRTLDEGRPTLEELEEQDGPLERLLDGQARLEAKIDDLLAFALERALGEAADQDETEDGDSEQDVGESGG